MNRRAFLAGTTAALIFPRATLARPYILRAEPVIAQILPEGDGTTVMLGFNGSTPVRSYVCDRVKSWLSVLTMQQRKALLSIGTVFALRMRWMVFRI